MSSEELRDLQESVRNIETAICGDERHGIEGMANKVKRHDKAINAHNKIIYIGTGVALVIGVIFKYFL